jgi:hypothetical protein
MYGRYSKVTRMIERVRRKRNPGSQLKAVAPAQAPRWRLFGEPPVLEGEDRAAYDELLSRIRAAVKPVDIIEEMFIADVASLEWGVLRLRRLLLSLIRTHALEALESLLAKRLEYHLYAELFVDDLTEILQNNLPEDQAKDAQTLALECAQNEPEAVAKVNEVLEAIGRGGVLDSARGRKAKHLVQEYVRREPDAVTVVHEVLVDNKLSMDSFMADALAAKLDYIERIDRLTTIAEERRNAMLAEIERRRAVLGAALRRSVQEVEDAEFKEIEETPAKGKNAA